MAKTELKPGKAQGEDAAAEYYRELDGIERRLTTLMLKENEISKKRDDIWEEREALNKRKLELKREVSKLFDIPVDLGAGKG